MKMLIYSLLLIPFIGLSQSASNKPIPWHGIVQIKIENKVFNYENVKDLRNLNRLILGASSQGLSSSIGPARTGFLPFEVRLIANDNLIHGSRIEDFEVSLLRSGVEDSNSSGTFINHFSIDLLSWDKRNYGENIANPLTIYRFKPFQARYVGVKKLGKNVNIIFKGKLGFFQSTIDSHLPESLKNQIQEYVESELKFGKRDGREGGIFSYTGIGLDGYRSMDVQRRLWDDRDANKYNPISYLKTFELFLGDSEFSLGVELFNFITASASISYNSDAVLDPEQLKFLTMNSVKRKGQINVNLGDLIKKSRVLNGVSVFAYIQSDKLRIRQEQTEDNGEIARFPELDFNNYNQNNVAGIGVRVRFGKRSKYKKVIKPLW